MLQSSSKTICQNILVIFIILFNCHNYSCNDEPTTTTFTIVESNNYSIKESPTTSSVNSQIKTSYNKTIVDYVQTEIPTSETCAIWIKRGCGCSELTDKIELFCKNRNLHNIPKDFPDKLYKLDLSSNKINEIEKENFVNLGNLAELLLSNNKIELLEKNLFPPNILSLEIKANPLKKLEYGAIQQLPKLRKLVLSDARGLSELPPLDGCKDLEIIRIDRANLTKVPDNFCKASPLLKILELKSNRLTAIPNLTNCRNLKLLDLSDNKITTLQYKPFDGLNQLHDLLMSYNQIESISFDSLTGLTKLQTLNMEGNRINFIHKDAFSAIFQLEDLNLGNNVFPDIPTKGLEKLLHLKTFNNPKLKEFPSPENFKRIKTLVLSYAYHCCAFLPLMKNNNNNRKELYTEEVYFPTDMEFDLSLWNNSFDDIWTSKRNTSSYMGNEMNNFLDTYENTVEPMFDEYYDDYVMSKATPSYSPVGTIHCLPTPGPFLPCEDLFDWWTLRCGVWVVFLLSVLGNGTVVFVLVFSRSKMDVPRFLVCNLAAADFFMGIYLGTLAVVDASTLGEFRMFAIPWQMSVGCQFAGFLAVLSSELSVYTLAVITLERNYAITHAMHLNKRLSIKHASYIMAIGWTFALTMAILPLFGVSDYRKFAVCLPFEVENGSGSLVYVVFLMFINGVAFLILMGCYLKMYCAIRGSQAWNSNDSRIAKRMALLVFTDFICWSPIAFFSLTAIFGVQLISLEQAKVFTVFVLPLNSCCNPFLYAILTKQFKKDCVMICKAIEESRVTRGIGRCRHSSNFSNRHTPGNTNSLIERSSRELPPLLTTCSCATQKVLEKKVLHQNLKQKQSNIFLKVWSRIFCDKNFSRGKRSEAIDNYSYQIAEISQKKHKRTGSMSSSENFSSSRSDSWRQINAHHHCNIPLRLIDPKRRHTSWLITRKTSQDSNLSSSRNDSSGSNTTATTASASTWKISRSSVCSNVFLPGPNLQYFHSSNARQSIPGNKPRLVRQSAVQEDTPDLLYLSPKLNNRILQTIPSAPDSKSQLDENEESENKCDNEVLNTRSQAYAVLKSGYPLTKLISPKSENTPP